MQIYIFPCMHTCMHTYIHAHVKSLLWNVPFFLGGGTLLSKKQSDRLCSIILHHSCTFSGFPLSFFSHCTPIVYLWLLCYMAKNQAPSSSRPFPLDSCAGLEMTSCISKGEQ